jgi:hypothetical protein
MSQPLLNDVDPDKEIGGAAIFVVASVVTSIWNGASVSTSGAGMLRRIASKSGWRSGPSSGERPAPQSSYNEEAHSFMSRLRL